MFNKMFDERELYIFSLSPFFFIMYSLERKSYGLKLTLDGEFSDATMETLTSDLKHALKNAPNEPISVVVDMQASPDTAVKKLIYILDATRNN
jgi:hypothetical protein